MPQEMAVCSIILCIYLDTVWKIAEGLSIGLLWWQETADRPPSTHFGRFRTLTPGEEQHFCYTFDR
jgi:hypothetical protein